MELNWFRYQLVIFLLISISQYLRANKIYNVNKEQSEESKFFLFSYLKKKDFYVIDDIGELSLSYQNENFVATNDYLNEIRILESSQSLSLPSLQATLITNTKNLNDEKFLLSTLNLNDGHVTTHKPRDNFPLFDENSKESGVDCLPNGNILLSYVSENHDSFVIAEFDYGSSEFEIKKEISIENYQPGLAFNCFYSLKSDSIFCSSTSKVVDEEDTVTVHQFDLNYNKVDNSSPFKIKQTSKVSGFKYFNLTQSNDVILIIDTVFMSIFHLIRLPNNQVDSPQFIELNFGYYYTEGKRGLVEFGEDLIIFYATIPDIGLNAISGVRVSTGESIFFFTRQEKLT